jgi:hypothetical protein
MFVIKQLPAGSLRTFRVAQCARQGGRILPENALANSSPESTERTEAGPTDSPRICSLIHTCTSASTHPDERPSLICFGNSPLLDLVVDRRSAKPYHGLDLGKTYQPLIHSITSRSVGQTRFIRAKRRFHESTLVRRREDHGAEMRTFRAHFARRGTLAVNGGGQLLYEGCGRSSSSVRLLTTRSQRHLTAPSGSAIDP